MIRLKNLLNKQFLTEAEAPQFTEYINLDDLEIKIDVNGTDLIQKSELNEQLSTYNIDLKPGWFDPDDVVTISVYIKKEALRKMSKEQKQNLVKNLDFRHGRLDYFWGNNYLHYYASTDSFGIDYTKKFDENLQRDGLICRSYIIPQKAFRITRLNLPRYDARERSKYDIDIKYEINLLNNDTMALRINLKFPENTYVEFSDEDEKWIQKRRIEDD